MKKLEHIPNIYTGTYSCFNFGRDISVYELAEKINEIISFVNDLASPQIKDARIKELEAELAQLKGDK